MVESKNTQLKENFTRYLPLPRSVEPHLRSALAYILKTPGSLARPEVALEMCLAFGLEISEAESLAMALEYFHTASLVLDDLPSMDDAAERRGAPAVHRVFGEAGAILAALALVNRAYALCWRAIARSSPARQAKAIAYIEDRLGIEGLLHGQSLDLHYAAGPHTRESTERIALGKTVSLVRLALVLPAVLGGASGGELRELERLALFWGLSYQILDDLKDVLQTSTTTGKTAARDAALDRPNIALIMGVPAALRRLERLIHLGHRSLHRLVLARPQLALLAKLRGDLQKQVLLITQHRGSPATSGDA